MSVEKHVPTSAGIPPFIEQYDEIFISQLDRMLPHAKVFDGLYILQQDTLERSEQRQDFQVRISVIEYAVNF